MKTPSDFSPLHIQDNHMCFACGPANPAGLKMRFFANQDSVVSWLTVPDHLRGWNTLVHGGVTSTILDEIMSWAAIHLLKTIILTKSMKVEFRKPVFIGQPLRAVGRVVEIINEREAVMEGLLYGPEGDVCAEARGTFALLKPKVARKLGIVDDQALRDLLPESQG
ncbi:MAG: PaaI family thioesterase [Deltaproteobacteria bacterium]|nr:PaaI family thioesterase [Deltaproteobacteria bacterium]